MSTKVAQFLRADEVEVGDYIRDDHGDVIDVVDVRLRANGTLVALHLTDPDNVYVYDADETVRVIGRPR